MYCTRIIGLKVALPPLQSPVPYQEPSKDYGFVMDSNMRVASTSSLSAARGLRENLSKMMASHNRSTEPPLTSRPATEHTNFDILSSARRSDTLPNQVSRTYERTNSDWPAERHATWSPPQTQVHQLQHKEHAHVESNFAQQDIEFAKMLANYKSNITASVPVEGSLKVASETHERIDGEKEVRNDDNMQYESEQENEQEELEEEVEEELVEQSQLAAPVPIASTARAPLPAPVPTRVPGPVATPAMPVPVPVAVPPTVSSTQAAKETIQPTAQSSSSESVSVASTASQATKDISASTVAPSEPSTSVAKDSELKKPSEVDQRARLEAWERELQEREQKVMQYMNSLSRPLGAKMPPKPMSHEEFSEDKPEPEERYQDRARREPPVNSALRGSAEIHIHNHIAPPPPAVTQSAAAPAVPSRSSYYESSTWQPSAYAPLKYGYSSTADSASSHTARAEEMRPSVQTRVPQRSPYAFPPAPYSSLGSGRGTVDLSGLSLEKMRELTGHY